MILIKKKTQFTTLFHQHFNNNIRNILLDIIGRPSQNILDIVISDLARLEKLMP